MIKQKFEDPAKRSSLQVPALGNFAVENCAVGNFAVGNFAVRKFCRKEISP